jgi:hypothetical protein
VNEFELRKPIGSCHVSLQLLQQLEDYLLREALRHIKGRASPRDEVPRRLTVSLVDNLGTEELDSIRDYHPSLLPDSTSTITLRILDYPVSFHVSITFHREPRSSAIYIKTTGDGAREVALSLFEGIRRLIDPHTTLNYVFHPSPWLELVYFMLGWSPLYLVFLFWFPLLRDYPPGVYPLLGLFAVLQISFRAAPRLKPFTSFESKVDNLKRKWSDWFVFGLAAFLLFGTVLILLRRKLLGF